MSYSARQVQYTIVYDTRQDAAYWVTIAQATRICAAVPVIEMIDEVHPARKEYERLAGPMPVTYHRNESADGDKADE